jgi:hypothetical protein
MIKFPYKEVKIMPNFFSKLFRKPKRERFPEPKDIPNEKEHAPPPPPAEPEPKQEPKPEPEELPTREID